MLLVVVVVIAVLGFAWLQGAHEHDSLVLGFLAFVVGTASLYGFRRLSHPVTKRPYSRFSTLRVYHAKDSNRKVA